MVDVSQGDRKNARVRVDPSETNPIRYGPKNQILAPGKVGNPPLFPGEDFTQISPVPKRAGANIAD